MEPAQPTLRIATPADAPRVNALMKQSAAGLFPAYYDERQTAAGVQYVAHIDPALLEDGTYFVLEVDDEMIACGGWSRRARPYAGSAEAGGDDRILDPKTEAANVRAMFVRPDWTRRGLGRRILEECEAAAARESYHRLALVATLPGVRLYLAFGFEPVGEQFDITLVDGVKMACLKMEKPIAATVPAVARPPAC
jgi:GNAT superfamily N-acetyltransferase